MRPWLVVLVLCCVGFACAGQEFEITAIGKDGTLTWMHPYTNGTFQVEWAVSPAGPWFTSWEDLLDLVPDGTGFVTVPVPVCYRVGWTADGTGSAAANDGKASVDADRDRDSGDVEVLPQATLGNLTWATAPDSTYRVEWASSAEGPWFTDWESLLGLTVPVVAAAVPVCYRVMCTGSCDPQMVYIPAGMFAMGDSFGEGSSDELPVHWIRISAFWMQRTEVTKAQWDEVYGWAIVNGYGFAMPGAGKGPDHSVQDIEWYDMVKWCNARSEKEELTPCYYTSAAKTTVVRSGRVDVQNDWVLWDADGYRLPTEAEWEYAARGGRGGAAVPVERQRPDSA